MSNLLLYHPTQKFNLVFPWVILLFLFHPVISYQDVSCKWRFVSCQKVTPIIYGKPIHLLKRCMVDYANKRENGEFCQPRHRQRKFDHRDFEFCSIDCKIIPSWCAWSSWVEPGAECGSSPIRLLSTRRRCCHPVTLKELSKSCGSLYGLQEQTKSKWRHLPPCPEEPIVIKGRDNIDPFVWIVAVAVSAVVVIATIITLIFCLKHRRRRRNVNRTRRYARAPHTEIRDSRPVPSAPPISSSHRLTPSSTPLHVSREAVEFDSPTDLPPPSYDEAQSQVSDDAPDSPPPRYEAALRLAK